MANDPEQTQALFPPPDELRHRAVQRIADVETDDVSCLGGDELRQALQELRVHQVELEMQNEELRRAQAEVETARQRYFDLYDLAPAGYCTLGFNGIIQEANLTLAQMLELDRDALLRVPLAKFIYQDDKPEFYRRLKILVETSRSFSLELRMSRAGRDPLWATMQATQRVGEPLARVVITDISDLKYSERSLRETTERLAAIQQYSPMLISEFDLEGRYLNANPALAGLLNRGMTELIGRRFKDLVPADIAQRFMSRVAEVKRTRRAVTVEDVLEMEGKQRHFLSTLFPLLDSAGEIRSIGGIAHDFTERKLLEGRIWAQNKELEQRVAERTAELREEQRKAEAASEAKSVFLANISHEIRTPMNAILGFADILRRDANLAPAQAERARTIMRNAEHLFSLINDILDMSKIEAGRAELQPCCFRLHDLLGGVVELFRAGARLKGLDLELETTPQTGRNLPRWVRGDQGRLRQILVNLLGNAIKFTGQGRVTLRAMAQEGAAVEGPDLAAHRVVTAVFEVEDTGPGIAEEDLELIFEPFRQTRQGQSFGGTGLGLPITRKSAELMGGRCTVTSQPGKGSIFRVEIPLVDASEEAGAGNAPRPDAPAPVPSMPATVPPRSDALSLAMRDSLIRMVNSGDIFGLLDLIEELEPGFPDVAAHLRARARSFDYQGIQQWLLGGEIEAER